MNIAIIPARGGSQRIPRKNIRNFCGKPIIAWSIIAAQNSRIFDRIIVSTDDKEIADIAKFYGAETPFVRPSEISDNYAPTVDVIHHALLWLGTQGVRSDYACCIYPTAPMLNIEDLQSAYKIISSESWDYVFSACEVKAYRSFVRDVSGGVKMIFPQNLMARTQDLPLVMNDAAQFYFGSEAAWMNKKPFFTQKSFPFLLPGSRVQDIDSLEDWKIAENLFKFNNVQL